MERSLGSILIDLNHQFYTAPCETDQLLGVHVVEDPLGVLAVSPTLHDGQQQLARVVLKLQHQVHPRLAQRVDVVQDQRRDDVQPVRLVRRYTVLATQTLLSSFSHTFSLDSCIYYAYNLRKSTLINYYHCI